MLDENIHVKFKFRLIERGITALTVADKKWSVKKNGELLQLMTEEGFTHLLTFDTSIASQQNFKRFPLPVIILIAPPNTYTVLMEMLEEIVRIIPGASIGPTPVIYPNYGL